jgi:hypothetical protein
VSPPLLVPIYCNHWNRGQTCGKTWAQRVAGSYFCVCCHRRVTFLAW